MSLPYELPCIPRMMLWSAQLLVSQLLKPASSHHSPLESSKVRLLTLELQYQRWIIFRKYPSAVSSPETCRENATYLKESACCTFLNHGGMYLNSVWGVAGTIKYRPAKKKHWGEIICTITVHSYKTQHKVNFLSTNSNSKTVQQQGSVIITNLMLQVLLSTELLLSFIN